MYSAAKFGLRGFALRLWPNLRATGIEVTCPYPRFIRESSMFADSGFKLPADTAVLSPKDSGSDKKALPRTS